MCPSVCVVVRVISVWVYNVFLKIVLLSNDVTTRKMKGSLTEIYANLILTIHIYFNTNRWTFLNVMRID